MGLEQVFDNCVGPVAHDSPTTAPGPLDHRVFFFCEVEFPMKCRV